MARPTAQIRRLRRLCWTVPPTGFAGGCPAQHATYLALAALALVLLAGCAAVPKGEMFASTDAPLVWPPAPEAPRIKWVGALAGSADLKAGKSTGEVLEDAVHGPPPPIQFSSPHGVAIRDDRWLAVADGGIPGVHILDLAARTHMLVSGWHQEERFAAPIGVAWAGERLFVTDAQRHEVIELSTGGTYRNRFGTDVLQRPVGIAYVAPGDRLYVVDGGAHGLVIFSPSGQVLATIGRNGVAPGEFNYPSHVAWNGGDLLAVVDTGNFRVQVLDLDGNCLRTIGQKGDAAGDFALPKGVAFDREGHLYVVDARFENVQLFDLEGRLLLAFGQEGTGRGEFSLPAGLAIDRDDRIWVADSANRRVQVFAYMRNAG